MHIREDRLESFLSFCRLNAEHWRIDDAHHAIDPSSGDIFVDLLSHGFNHSVRTLLTAKYLQRIRGGRLVGLVGPTIFNTVLFSGQYEVEPAMRLARSFGVEAFLEIADCEPGATRGRAVARSLAGEALERLPERLFALREDDGCEIGRYIYETCLRTAVSHKLLAWGERDEQIVAESYAIHDRIAAHCASHRVAAFVTGHITFNKWGLVADGVLRHGGLVLYVNHDGNFSVDILRRPPEPGETLMGVRRTQRDAMTKRFLEAAGNRLDALADKVAAQLDSGQLFQPFWWVPQRLGEPSQRAALRASAREKLGLSADSRPLYGIFSHCFSDAPTSDEQLYFDYHDWLTATLEVAVSDPSKKWLCKVHPSMRTYGGEAAMNAIIERFSGHAHVVFVHEEITKAELFAACDCAITIRGSLGYDMAAAGVPVIAAGQSTYSALDVALVPKTVAEYEALLRAPAAELPRDPGRANRAKRFILFNVGLLRVGSLMLMPTWSRTADVWEDLASRLQANMYELDPAFTSLAASLEAGLAMCVNLELARWIDPSLVPFGPRLAWTHAAGSPVDAGYALGDVVTVGVSVPRDRHLVSGVAAHMDGGTLSAGRPALFYLEPREVPEGRLGLFVELAALPGRHIGGTIDVRLDGALVQTISVPPKPLRFARIVDLPRAALASGRPLVLELTQRGGPAGRLVLKQLAIDLRPRLEAAHGALIRAIEQESLPAPPPPPEPVTPLGLLRRTPAWKYLRAARRGLRKLARPS